MPESARAVAIAPPHILSSDAEFDSAYDFQIRELSQQHWTPVRVAARVAHLLTRAGATRILDVGSGVEAEPGLKDPRKLRTFFEALRPAARGGTLEAPVSC